MNMMRMAFNFCCLSFSTYLLACGDSSSAAPSSLTSSLPQNGGSTGLTTGSVTDSRDNQTYKTVKIGNQVWMAQNLNFATNRSFCYNNDSLYCNKYGRLYNPCAWNLSRRLAFAFERGMDSTLRYCWGAGCGWNST